MRVQKRVYARETCCGGCGGLRGTFSRAPLWRSEFLTRKSLKTGVKNFKLFSLYGSPQSPANFLFERAALAKSPRHPPRPPQIGIQTLFLNYRCCGGSPHNHRAHFSWTCTPQRLANRVRSGGRHTPTRTGSDVRGGRQRETERQVHHPAGRRQHRRKDPTHDCNHDAMDC